MEELLFYQAAGESEVKSRISFKITGLNSGGKFQRWFRNRYVSTVGVAA